MVDNVVRTERWELVDRRGRIRAVLACEEDSELPSCTFLDAAGPTRVIVGLSWNEVPAIQLTAPERYRPRCTRGATGGHGYGGSHGRSTALEDDHTDRSR